MFELFSLAEDFARLEAQVFVLVDDLSEFLLVGALVIRDCVL
jgi:hypothetical protein